MNLADAFLLFTAVSYYAFASTPKPTTRNIRPFWLEKVTMIFCGTLILSNLLFLNNSYLWLVMGIFWSIGACISYLGYIIWKVNYADMSDAAQIWMTIWDTLISLCCFIKF